MHRRFYRLNLKREMVVLKTRRRYARFVYDEENGCRFEGLKKEIWIFMQQAWLIAVRERILEFYSD